MARFVQPLRKELAGKSEAFRCRRHPIEMPRSTVLLVRFIQFDLLNKIRFAVASFVFKHQPRFGGLEPLKAPLQGPSEPASAPVDSGLRD